MRDKQQSEENRQHRGIADTNLTHGGCSIAKRDAQMLQVLSRCLSRYNKSQQPQRACTHTFVGLREDGAVLRSCKRIAKQLDVSAVVDLYLHTCVAVCKEAQATGAVRGRLDLRLLLQSGNKALKSNSTSRSERLAPSQYSPAAASGWPPYARAQVDLADLPANTNWLAVMQALLLPLMNTQ